MKDPGKLATVATLAAQARTGKAEIDARHAELARTEKAALDKSVDDAVIAALEDGHPVTAVARAYTPPGSTPNRNAIYAIKRENLGVIRSTNYPFEWHPRTVRTALGEKVVYDVHALLHEFGTEDVSGEYQWTWDVEREELEPVITSGDPYPTSKYYQHQLTQWLTLNPYPGNEATAA